MAISIHAPTRGATLQKLQSAGVKGISIHAPTRGATIFAIFSCTGLFISIHAPTRGATQETISLTEIISDFNPRSHKGSDRWNSNNNLNFNYFNPRSHKGSDISKLIITCNCGISIHAPTRGATTRPVTLVKCFLLFQSTLPQGERHPPHTATLRTLNFNPRSHKGSDGHRELSDLRTEIISIHAPTRGATPLSSQILP